MSEKKNGSAKTSVVILTLLLVVSLVVGGYYTFQYFNDDQKNNITNNNNETTKENNSEEAITVIDAVSFTETRHDASSVTLPKITSTKENAEKLNKQMLSEVLSRRYNIPTTQNDCSTSYAPKGIVTNYSYVIKNDIIAIGINESGEYVHQGSGSGLNHFVYFYDTKNDRIIEKLSEAARLMELTDLDGASDYESLDKNACTKARVEDNKVIIDYEEACA